MRIEPLLQWLKETPAEVAEQRCADYGTSVGYLRQIAYGNKRAALNGADIEKITDGRCTRQHLRPDDYWRIWPELAQKEPTNA
jgi:DNA-binding transcriptional regulator YdaS (Cro superfamily)